ncbi:MAG TPA: glycogen/starch/alpha-glucan phosphorylase [Candidatus Binataceae bacterium]|nr:glycogen/starch/alpha-glucan phosphorylase [Candidatus Binataceae bacterium]
MAARSTSEPQSGDSSGLAALIAHHIRFSVAKPRGSMSRHDWYNVTALAVRDMLVERMLAAQAGFERTRAKKLYYLSLEYLIGRSLENNLFNLGIIDECREFLAENGIGLQPLFDEEVDAALGNGGLGRLAACFLDSLATLGMPGYAYGINYEFGLFRQQIRDGYQVERPDSWRRDVSPWLVARPEAACIVPVYGRIESRIDDRGEYRPRWTDYQAMVGIPSDLPISGFNRRTVNFVRLFAARASDEFDIQIFNAGDYLKAVEQKVVSETISKVLYPSDAVQSGRELRLLQEYFFVACAIRDIVRGFFARGEDVHDFPAKVAIQLNDTHPALAIAELMRTFVDQYGLPWDEAWGITRQTVAYTNHTLMPEALERWPVDLMRHVVPRHLEIIYEINRRFLAEAIVPHGDAIPTDRVSIVEEGFNPQIRMAHLAIIGSHSVNGVSKLHSEMLKSRLVPEFNALWPERFNNKTNGITQRRWLLMANPGLSRLLDETIGDRWRIDLEHTREIERFADDSGFQKRFMAVKRANKDRLATIVHRIAEVDIDPASILDVQAKRIHEYKRQLLMALGIVHEYLRLVEDSVEPATPRTYVIAGKAAPGYWAAKMIIKLINNLAAVINPDPRTRGLIKVVFAPDYRVSLAEKIIPAADISEQISTAGTEASGTGNMKFALNGALTIGTLDGANIEIREEVGTENIFIFGLTAPAIERIQREGTHNPRQYYETNPDFRRVLDALSSDRFCPREPGLFRWIPEKLRTHDEYFVAADFASYIETQELLSRLYLEPAEWTRKAILNVARIGRFSSDRTVAEYAREIWGLTPASESAC